MSEETTQTTGIGIAGNGSWERVLSVACQVTVELEIKNFCLHDLAALKKGAIINSHCAVGHDVPVYTNGLLLGWGQFEAVGRSLAIRLGDLA